jgi:hypothetical protein
MLFFFLDGKEFFFWTEACLYDYDDYYVGLYSAKVESQKGEKNGSDCSLFLQNYGFREGNFL